jgi:hypothetical protein
MISDTVLPLKPRKAATLCELRHSFCRRGLQRFPILDFSPGVVFLNAASLK